MTKKLLTAHCLMILMVCLTMVLPACSARAAVGGESGGSESLSDIFATQPAQEVQEDQTQRFQNVGPALLLVGIVLLAASGRQYANQHTYINQDRQMVQDNLEALIDDSVTIDSTEAAGADAKLEALRDREKQLIATIQKYTGR